MHSYQLDLDEPVSGAHRDELHRRVYYLSESITGFRLVPGGPGDDAVGAVVVTTDRPVDAEALGKKLRYVVDTEVLPQLRTQPKVLWRSPSPRTPRTDTFAGLLADGVVHESGPGQVALGAPALAALEALDGLLREIIQEEFGAREYRYPTLLPVSALHRSGYLSSFPQHLMFAARLEGDVDTYRAFAEEAGAREGGIGERVLHRCAPVDRALPPTMCYHTFDQFAGDTLPDENTVVTAKGGSFRHESRYHQTMERLADFTIRETVFLGTAEFVRGARDRFRLRATELVERLDLAGRCEVASDPFFAGAATAAQVSSQRLLELKHELHLDVGPGESISVGSFNLHEKHFGEAFGIKGPDGGTVYSACVGFGLERLTYALLCQYGWDVDDWPAPLKERCRDTPRASRGTR
ncbi:hypothetical protein ACFW6V_03715 [Streptomyces sp. NPDC058734]|uniref:hypothetical protein n=1 Tax=Streptomyces sp. NPDC058734 TaxID=3346615 RepID=UPI00367A2386